MAVQPRLASAVMLLRPASEPGQGGGREKGRGFEVFMVRRVIQSDFMPDVYVFPGGSVSADDRAAEQTEGICAPVASSAADPEGRTALGNNEAVRATLWAYRAADPEGRTALGNGTRAAAIRELFEEAGILLAERDGQMLAVSSENERRFEQYREAFQQRTGSLVQMATTEHLTLATGLLNYFAHWITPEGMPKRFDTHFFVATAPNEQQAAYDQLETSEGIWIAPAEALARFERGEFPIVFATIYQLRELAAFSSVQDALQYTATHHVPVRQPVLIQQEGTVRVHLPDEADNSWVVPEHMRKQ